MQLFLKDSRKDWKGIEEIGKWYLVGHFEAHHIVVVVNLIKAFEFALHAI